MWIDEFGKGKEDLNGCEIDCGKINDETNIYCDLSKKNDESTMFPESTNIENNILSGSTNIKSIEYLNQQWSLILQILNL